MKTLVIATMLSAAMLSGCAGLSERQQRIGSGAIIGGAVGNRTIGGVGGTAAGAAIGGLIGNEVDRSTRERRYEDCLRNNSRRYCDRNVN